MSAVTFDTLAFARKLEDKGVCKEHAEAHAQALSEVLIEERSVAKQTTEISANNLSTELAMLRHELKADIADVRAELSNAKAEIIKWVFGISIAQAALIISLIKLLH